MVFAKALWLLIALSRPFCQGPSSLMEFASSANIVKFNRLKNTMNGLSLDIKGLVGLTASLLQPRPFSFWGAPSPKRFENFAV